MMLQWFAIIVTCIFQWSYQELSTYGDCKDRLLREAHMMTSTSALIGGELRAEVRLTY